MDTTFRDINVMSEKDWETKAVFAAKTVDCPVCNSKRGYCCWGPRLTPSGSGWPNAGYHVQRLRRATRHSKDSIMSGQ